MIGGTVNRGGAADRMRSIAAAANDETVMRKAMFEAASPLANRMRENIDRIRGRKFPRRHTNKTRDAVTIEEATENRGTVRLLIGLRGGKGGRAYVGRYLERGTSKMPAYPWARPAADAEGGDKMRGRLVANLKRIFFGRTA